MEKLPVCWKFVDCKYVNCKFWVMELLSFGTTEKVEKVVFFSVFFVHLKY